MKALEKAKSEGRSLWRVSSTLFSNIASGTKRNISNSLMNKDAELKPLGSFETKEALQQYPPILAGDQVEDELRKIYPVDAK